MVAVLLSVVFFGPARAGARPQDAFKTLSVTHCRWRHKMKPIVSFIERKGSDVPLGQTSARRRYRQARPYNMILPTEYGTRSVFEVSGPQAKVDIVMSSGEPAVAPSVMGATHNPKVYRAYNPVYEAADEFDWIVSHANERAWYDFLSNVKTASAQTGLLLLELKESATMISSRLTQFADFLAALRGRQFGRAFDLLGVTAHEYSGSSYIFRDETGKRIRARVQTRYFPDAESRQRQFASNLLELTFGWLPLVEDMYSFARVWNEPVAGNLVKGRGKEFAAPSFRVGHSLGQAVQCDHLIRATTRIGAEVFVTNPNLHLMEKLGLTNPAALLFDAYPLSFVVGWFTTFDEWLRSLTSLAGTEVKNFWMTTRVTSFLDAYRIWVYEGQQVTVRSSSFSQTRSPSPPKVLPRLHWPKVSLGKAISSAALVRQRLP